MIVGRVEGGAWVDRVVLWIGTAIIDRKRLVYQVFPYNPLPFSYRGVRIVEERNGISIQNYSRCFRIERSYRSRRVTTCPEHRDY